MTTEERSELTMSWDTTIGYMLYSLFVLLLISVMSLISRLKKVRDVMFQDHDDQRKVFDKEIRTLWVILGVFNSTYLIRGLWNQLDLAQDKYYKLVL